MPEITTVDDFLILAGNERLPYGRKCNYLRHPDRGRVTPFSA